LISITVTICIPLAGTSQYFPGSLRRAAKFSGRSDDTTEQGQGRRKKGTWLHPSAQGIEGSREDREPHGLLLLVQTWKGQCEN